MTFNHHLVFISAPSWGHCRPTLPICFKMVKERPDIVVTYFVVGQFKARMDREVARYFTGEHSALKENIRIVKISDFDGGEFEYWDLIMKLSPEFLQKLLDCEPIVCFSGQTYPPAPKPEICIVDGTLSPLGLRLISEEKCKIWYWSAASIFAALHLNAPTEFGGHGELEQEAKKLAEKTNISIQDATFKLFAAPSDEIRKIPGLPPAYDYEFLGEHSIPGAVERWIELVKQLTAFLHKCHGSIFANSPLIEEGGVKFTKEWFDKLGKSCYTLGPCMLPNEVDLHNEESSRGQEVVTFLDKIYETHGKNSLLYMSFGTSAFPTGTTPWQLIDIILDTKIPLVLAMSHGNTYENTLPQELRNRLESSELALVAKWTPQQLVLSHSVTGVFFTHAGQGSLTESLCLGVPMIIWPIQADQPHNAMNLTLNLKVAYQLLEVRIKHGLKPLHRGYQPKGTKEAIDAEFRQVLKDAFGPDGEAKRRIALDLSKKLKETWEEGGEAMFELRRMLQDSFS